MNKRVLIVTPKFPYPSYGACEQDRAAGIEWFIRQGWDVRVITKIYSADYAAAAAQEAKRLGIPIVAVPYKNLFAHRQWWKRLASPWYLDGAAYEYTDPDMQQAVRRALQDFRPSLAWFDYTYLWPLYGAVRAAGVPIITRSINFEPRHFLDEDGRSPLNYLRAAAKWLTEYRTVRESDVLCAITPQEERAYRRLGARRLVTLPLRGLGEVAASPPAYRERTPLNVFFAGSTYRVAHNRAAVELIVAGIAPRCEQQWPGQFRFHILGRKLPADIRKRLGPNCVYHDHLERPLYEALLADMDIALIPSLYGAGMQQKIFEPLLRGFPTITSARGLAGYSFDPGVHLLVAESVAEFVSALGSLRDPGCRHQLGAAARSRAAEIIGGPVVDRALRQALHLAGSVV